MLCKYLSNCESQSSAKRFGCLEESYRLRFHANPSGCDISYNAIRETHQTPRSSGFHTLVRERIATTFVLRNAVRETQRALQTCPPHIWRCILLVLDRFWLGSAGSAQTPLFSSSGPASLSVERTSAGCAVVGNPVEGMATDTTIKVHKIVSHGSWQ